MSAATYLQMIGLVFFFCGLLILGAWGLRRLQRARGPQGPEIKVKAVRSLTHKAQLALVEIEGEEILIGLGEGGPRLICRLGKKDASS